MLSQSYTVSTIQEQFFPKQRETASMLTARLPLYVLAKCSVMMRKDNARRVSVAFTLLFLSELETWMKQRIPYLHGTVSIFPMETWSHVKIRQFHCERNLPCKEMKRNAGMENTQKSYMLREGISEDCVLIYFQGFQRNWWYFKKLWTDRIFSAKWSVWLLGFFWGERG